MGEAGRYRAGDHGCQLHRIRVIARAWPGSPSAPMLAQLRGSEGVRGPAAVSLAEKQES